MIKNISEVLAAIVVFALAGLGIWYVGSRLAFIFETSSKWWNLSLAILMVIGFTALGVESYSWTNNGFMHTVVIVGSVLVGFSIYLVGATIIVDLVRIIIKMPKMVFGCLIGVLSIGLTIYTLIAAFSVKVTNVDIPIADSGLSGTKIVLLSDTHWGHFRGKEFTKKIVNMINEQQPDIVLFTGDAFESWYNFNEETLEPFNTIEAPIYFVDGNHDEYVDSRKVKELLKASGIIVLENEIVEDHGLTIVGLDYMNADAKAAEGMHAAKGKDTIQDVVPILMKDCSDSTVIVMHHAPTGAEYIEKMGADIYVAGHTHGGQLWPMTWYNDLVFDYNRGLKKSGNMWVYVTNGLGTFGPPMRLGTQCELTVITLTN